MNKKAYSIGRYCGISGLFKKSSNSNNIQISKFSTNVNPKKGKRTWEKENPIFTSYKKYAPPTHAKTSLKLGPHAGGKLWTNPREDPVTFVANCLIIACAVYCVSNLSQGEGFLARRKRIIRQRILKEYDMTEAELEDIEDEDPFAEM
eukprot:GHVL01022947.1.p1 GENE.GHVL01022947.1~~GHVL01022947.1.p1  ORF type:complete len:159 (+),score=43.82 GHVL01022947.1:36-479(+)